MERSRRNASYPRELEAVKEGKDGLIHVLAKAQHKCIACIK